MAIRTVIPTRIAERTTPKLTAVLKDENNAGIPAAALATLRLTLYRAGDITAILNNRNEQNVLNQNGVTVDASGNLVWVMSALDNALLTTAREEAHIALFEWTWGSGREGAHELVLFVINLAGRP